MYKTQFFDVVGNHIEMQMAFCELAELLALIAYYLLAVNAAVPTLRCGWTDINFP